MLPAASSAQLHNFDCVLSYVCAPAGNLKQAHQDVHLGFMLKRKQQLLQPSTEPFCSCVLSGPRWQRGIFTGIGFPWLGGAILIVPSGSSFSVEMLHRRHSTLATLCSRAFCVQVVSDGCFAFSFVLASFRSPSALVDLLRASPAVIFLFPPAFLRTSLFPFCSCLLLLAPCTASSISPLR